MAANLGVWWWFGDNVKYLKLAIKRNCGSTNQAPKIYLLSYLNVHFMNNSSRSFHTPPDSHLIENRKKKTKRQTHKTVSQNHHSKTAQTCCAETETSWRRHPWLECEIFWIRARWRAFPTVHVQRNHHDDDNNKHSMCAETFFYFFKNNKINCFFCKRALPQSNNKITMQQLFCVFSFSFFFWGWRVST